MFIAGRQDVGQFRNPGEPIQPWEDDPAPAIAKERGSTGLGIQLCVPIKREVPEDMPMCGVIVGVPTRKVRRSDGDRCAIRGHSVHLQEKLFDVVDVLNDVLANDRSEVIRWKRKRASVEVVQEVGLHVGIDVHADRLRMFPAAAAEVERVTRRDEIVEGHGLEEERAGARTTVVGLRRLAVIASASKTPWALKKGH